MANRKLQTEIERALKKVNEGIVEFEGFLKKVYSANSSNQKEKHENDMKKEIKKLQRLREQLKSWISSNEIKNKAPLVDARKRIETEMERFKTYEKEAKTKAYSKEGLMSARESAKKEDPKNEIRAWLQKNIDALKIQIDAFEVKLGTSKGSDYDHYAHRLERHHYHLNCLEKILRMWENDQIQKQQIEEIKDSVDYYVENNQDADFVEDETIYEGFDMKATEPESEPKDDSEGSEEATENVNEKSTENNQTTNKETTSAAIPTADPNGSGRRSTPAPTPPPSVPTASTTPPTSAISSSLPISSDLSTSRRMNDRRRSSQPSDPPKGTLAELAFATVARAQPPQSSQQQQHSGKNVEAAHTHQHLSASTSHPPARSLGASAPTPVATSTSTPAMPPLSAEKTKSNVHPAHSPRVHTMVSPVPSTAVPILNSFRPGELNVSTENVLPATTNSSTVVSAGTIATATPVSTTSSSGVTPPGATAPISPPPPTIASTTTTTAPTSSSSIPSSTPVSVPTPTSASTSTPISPTTPIPAPISTSNIVFSTPTSATTTTTTPPVSSSSTVSVSANMPISSTTPSSTTQLIGKPSSSLPGNPASQNELMLELSYENIPGLDPQEEQLEEYRPRHPKPSTPSFYPQTVAPIFDNPVLFEKFDIDTLFFIFYYQQGSYQQYLAAKELKRQMWRYHKKYLTWFQRHEEPKQITPDYEQGTYVYFDYETGWCQRKKTEFTFEYKYLEDKELV